MDTRRKFVEGLVSDPAKTLKIKAKFTTEDLDNLKKIPGLLKVVLTQDKKAVQKATKLLPKLVPVIKNLGTQVVKDPLKATDYKRLIGQLNAGQKKLTVIPSESTRQLKAADAMGGAVVRLMKKEEAK